MSNERKPADKFPQLPCGESIDSPEFWAVMADWVGARGTSRDVATRSALIAHIDGFIDAKLTEARRGALEEAARICDETWVEPGDMQTAQCTEAAEAIRRLTVTPASDKA